MTQTILTALTRISDLATTPYTLAPLPPEAWRGGDYVAGVVRRRPHPMFRVEVASGRHLDVLRGHTLIGALGMRYATLEATGDWRHIGSKGHMHLLTGGGVMAYLTSTSPFLPLPISLRYVGHVWVQGRPANMHDYAPQVTHQPFTRPVVLVIGTSMSAGKTTGARVVIQTLKTLGYRVAGAKLTGAGHLKDVLSMRDAGADHIFDFVDVGLPTTVCPEAEYRPALDKLLTLIEQTGVDVAVIEMGASPLEPYNGAAAIAAIAPNICYTILCASDPYAVVGLITAYGRRPDLVTGVTTNTLAGCELVEKLSGVPALNLLHRKAAQKVGRAIQAAITSPPPAPGLAPISGVMGAGPL